MAEPTSRIEPMSSFREPDRNVPSRGREKKQPKTKMPSDLEELELAAADEQDEQEKHTLDTLA